MRVLVVGCNGQVGILLKKMLASEVELLALTREELDITNEYRVYKVIGEFNPDVVVNAAAYTQVDNAESEEILAFAVNCDGAGYLAKAANKENAALVHLSTDYVFDGNKVGLYSESDSLNPHGVYGKSKLAGEEAVSRYCSKNIILRTSWVFGEYGNNFVKTMLRLANDRDNLRIVDDQYGGPTYAGDIVKIIIEIIKKIETEEFVNWGVYHYSGMPYVSWYEFAQDIFSNAKQCGLLASIPTLTAIGTCDFITPAVRPSNSKLNCEKIKLEFGVLPSDWKSALYNIDDYS